MNFLRPLVIGGLLISVTACSTTNADGTSSVARPLIPDQTVNFSTGVSMALEKVVFWGAYASVAYLILDPLAPNWDIEQAAFPDSYFHLSLKMKRVYSGGAGEARVVFNQRAKDLMRQNGYESYEIVEYSEGLESSVLGSQRVSKGVIRLVRK